MNSRKLYDYTLVLLDEVFAITDNCVFVCIDMPDRDCGTNSECFAKDSFNEGQRGARATSNEKNYL